MKPDVGAESLCQFLDSSIVNLIFAKVNSLKLVRISHEADLL